MAVTSKLFGPFLQSLANAEVDFDTATVKAMLCTSAYTPDQDTHRYKSSVTGEVVGSGYTAGGATLTGKAVTYNPATNTLTLDAADPSWPAATITARYVVFLIDTGTPGTSPLISYVDLGSDVSTTAATWTYQIPAAGIASITAS